MLKQPPLEGNLPMVTNAESTQTNSHTIATV